MNDAKKPKTWDIPTRLTHWTLAGLVIAAFITGDGIGGDMDTPGWGENLSQHRTIAIWIVGLLVFRLVWGFIGNAQAKFKNFPFNLGELSEDIKTFSKKDAKHYPGHGPTGAWATIAILGLVALQVVTGLFSSNVEENVHGPLALYAPQIIADAALWIHGELGGLFMYIILIHVVAVLWHELVRGHKLLAAMFTGSRPVQEGVKWESEKPKRAVVLAVVSLIIVVALFAI
ncbi:MAG: cytochrome b/b6 domain-containing protein [Alphaproteobacteria bacterium]|nr:cytochrome b/b6 domain-containing protein [Alphaproteobacteria bacterium]MDA8006499.1 cytochrome b/b6 domain-containing protein [Alphaproteobacteria bacterium]MDA8013213.1 cytochrome b/b6 domain-containing protein [Alphaproteobacteria bacterium]